MNKDMIWAGQQKNTFSKQSKQKIRVYVRSLPAVGYSTQLLSLVITTGGHNHTNNKCSGHYSVAEVNLHEGLIS